MLRIVPAYIQHKSSKAQKLNKRNWNTSHIFLIQIFLIHLQERALHYVDGVDGDVEIADGIKLVETEKPESNGRSLNDVQLPADAEEREAEIDSLLVDRVARFLGSHTLQFKVTKDSINDMQRSLEEGKSSHFLSIFMKKILPNKLSNVTLTARKMKMLL